MAESPGGDKAVSAEEVPICPNCMKPCDPRSYYCPNCNSNEVINPLASYMPFTRIRFTTGVFVKLCKRIYRMRRKTRWAIVLLVIVIIIWLSILPH